MINKLAEISKKFAEDRKNDPEQIEIMNRATKEQVPRYLLISQINRSSQDLQLLRMEQGDSFQATRIPRLPLLPPKQSLFLFSGPASYNRKFPMNEGVVVTFDKTEHPEVIKQTLENISMHPALEGISAVALIVDYDSGEVRLIAHGKNRNYGLEVWLLKHLSLPDLMDNRILVIICSDSRVRPPITPSGVPMAIRTLGGYIPKFTGLEDETAQLDLFFQEWLSTNQNGKQIIIAAHGAFSGEGSSCGIGSASLNPEPEEDKYLSLVIKKITEETIDLETSPSVIAEQRVKTIAKVTKLNLFTYPGIIEFTASNQKSEEFIQLVLIDTITNILSEFED